MWHVTVTENIRGIHDNYEVHVRPLLDELVARYRSRIIAIILAGSVARGEITIKNGQLLSDFDLQVVIRSFNPWVQAGIKKLAKRYANALPFQISIRVIALREYRSGNRLTHYDAKKTGKVIFGDNGILDEIEFVEPDSIPHWEGLRLLLNRATGLLEVARYPGRIDENRYYIAMSYLAIGEAYLIFSGRYKPTCIERMIEISSDCKLPIATDFVTKFATSSRFKLNQCDMLPGLNFKIAVVDMVAALNYFSALFLQEKKPLTEKIEVLCRRLLGKTAVYVKLIIMRHLLLHNNPQKA